MRYIEANNRSLIEEFIVFPRKIYPGGNTLEFFIKKSEEMIREKNGFRYFVFKSDAETIGRVAVGFNAEIKDEKGSIFGQIAFLETVNDESVFSFVMDTALQFLKRHGKVLFPFFFSTWHNYRLFVKNDFDFFLDPPFNPYYVNFMEKFDFEEKVVYRTSKCRDMDRVIENTEKHYLKAVDEGITFRNLDKKNVDNELKLLYDLSIRGFAENKFYAPISYDEFAKLYKGAANIVDPELITFAIDENGNPAGFIFSLPDYSPLFFNLNLNSLMGKLKFLLRKRSGVEGFLVKSVTVLPEMRNRYIYSAIIYLHMSLAKKRKYRYMIGTYYIDSNYSARFLPEISDENIYELYVIKNRYAET